jgi:hypothetical protein
LAASVSDYLITQLKATPQNIEVRLRTRVADGHGQVRLEALTLEDVRTGQRDQAPAAAVFGMIGTEPRTQWVRDLVKLNDRGFILTGRTFPGRMTAAPSTPAVRDEPAGHVRGGRAIRLHQARRKGGRRGATRSDPGFGIYAGLPPACGMASDEIRLLQ